MTDFTHLHCHTEYSFLDGAIKIHDLCERARGLGMTSVAVTDHGNMCAAMPLYLKSKEFGLKAIFGSEFYTCHDHTDESRKEERFHLVLLAQNEKGYGNLIKLSSLSYEPEYFFRKPRIDRDALRRHSEGLICLSACLSGEIPKAILAGDMDTAQLSARELAAIFPGRFYLEVQKNRLDEQEMVNTVLQELAEAENIPLVATADCHYLIQTHAPLQDVAVCIGTNKKIDDPNRLKMDSSQFFFKGPTGMERDFKDIPEAIENAKMIGRLCNVELQTGKHFFPAFPIEKLMKPKEKLAMLAQAGLKKLKLNQLFNYQTRLADELDVIDSMGFTDYFLIVQDFVAYAKSEGIPVGPGRGSAAGSLMAYALGITEIDPIRHGLLFERFLNPERISLPDIDIDFCERRRDEVIRYMEGKYGADRVARIATFNAMKARSAIRDIARVYGVSLPDADRLAKMIPETPGMTLEKAGEYSAIKKMLDGDEKLMEVFETAKFLEGTIRHSSVHAAGIIVSDRPLSERMPTWRQKDVLLTQFDGPMAETAGMLKFDFLGLSTLTLINDTLGSIGGNLDISAIPLDDPLVYGMLSRGETAGVFQVEGEGITGYMRKLQPERFGDLVAMLALYRPGPLGCGMVDSYIRRRHGQEEITYPHPALEGCLAETYGVIVYQEQVMEIAREIAGYTLGQADILRRAMGKKKPEVMEKERERFLEGAARKRIDYATATGIFDQMAKFAEYGFNKSHSAAYALLTYRTAWLKAHYPAHFMAALLTGASEGKKAEYAQECRRLEIDILQPDINASQKYFTVEGGRIRWGLCGIKGVGEKAVEEILAKRVDGYESVNDFLAKVSKRSVTKMVLEKLIHAGAFDCFGLSRKALMGSGQKDMLTCGSEYPQSKLLEMEFEALGVYLSGDPLKGLAVPEGCVSILDCAGLEGRNTAECVAMVAKIKKSTTKTGKPMARLAIQDRTGAAELTVWSEVLEKVEFKANEAYRFMVQANDFKGWDKEDQKIRLVCKEAVAMG